MSAPDQPPSLLGKRKKPVPKCANPLFVAWLTEWRDEAKEKGLNSQYTYSRALSSLKKYPVPMKSGKDCKILEFFGDKMCKMLDDRLTKHIAEYGHTDVPEKEDDFDLIPRPPGKQKTKQKVNDNETGNEPKRRRTKSREYIPAHRSAAYALILTLFNDSQSATSHGFMTKKNLLEEAQPLADASLSAPEHGSGYYSGWSSMGTLIKKGFVTKDGNPAKYYITQTGTDLARKVMAGTNFDDNDEMDLSMSTPGVSSYTSDTTAPSTSHAAYPSFENDSVASTSASIRDTVCSSGDHSTSCYDKDKLTFTYVDADGNCVRDKDHAAVTINEELGVGFMIKSRYTDLLMSSKRYQIHKMNCGDGERCLAYLHNEDADQYSNMPVAAKPVPAANKTVSSNTVPPQYKPQSYGSNLVEKPSAKINKRPQTLTKEKVLPSSTVGSTKVTPVVNKETLPSLPFNFPKPNSQSSSANSQDVDSVPDSNDRNFETITFQPGSYTILLCVDNREYFGPAGASKQNLLAELNRNGVNVDVRNLAVGDFVWVARENVGARTGQLNLPQSRELVLDWIVERKRMDDLCGSIKDGRYKEQKFRIRNCGLRRPVYLVEAYDKNLGLPQESMHQAIVNSQVVDNFYIKHTRDQKSTVAYLTIMTRQLQRKFANRILISCPRTEVTKYDHELTQNGPLHLLHFSEFNKLNLKNQALTVRDIFAKQLMTLRGLSQDKASSLLRTYPTIRSLMEAYRGCSNDREREQLLMGRDLGLGSANSKVLFMLYNTRVLQ